VIVENRAGLPGTTGVAKSPPDGYTLMLTSNGHTIAAAINQGLQFDPVKDFAGVTEVAAVPLVMVVPPDFPARTLQEFIAIAKEKPGTLNFSSAGVASTTFLSAEILRQNAGVKMVHVPYKGTPEAITAVVRGDAHLFFAPIPTALELGAAGKVRIVAINSAKRMPQLPDTPTLVEAGLPDYKYDSWFGVMAPAGTPKPILDKISRDIARVLQMTDVKDKLEVQGAFPAPTTPGEFDAIIRSDTERYGKILRDAGVGTN
jgi:tripartite-type tricarboxylate transporter receptor subunit TctC